MHEHIRFSAKAGFGGVASSGAATHLKVFLYSLIDLLFS